MPGPGGSRKGRPNKLKQLLLARLEERFGKEWHPVLKMAEIAQDESNPIELRASMYKEVAQYVTPKLKAIDHTFGGEGHFEVVVDIVPHDK